jgi:D-inositol-3-phosphate glycosyltransferase
MGQLGSKDTGGMNVYVRELSRRLGEIGHRIDIYTRAHDPRDAKVEWPFPNVRLIHIQAGALEDMGKMSQYSHLPDFIQNMMDFITGDGAQYDLVHSHYWLSGEVGQYFAQLWHVPHWIMFHTLGAVKAGLPVGDPESEVRLLAETKLVYNCERIITATLREKNDLARMYQASLNKVSVIPCGVNLERFQPLDSSLARHELGLNINDELIVFVGRIEPLKGIDRLIQAIGLLKHHNGIRLLVIGGDEHSRPEVERLKKLANNIGVEDRISFLGAVLQEKLSLYYNAADVSVVASYYESFCLVILESLACGTPVVSTNVGIAPGVIVPGINGYISDNNAPEKLAAHLEMVLGTGMKDAVKINTIRASVVDFDWKAIARMVALEYERLLNRVEAAP